MIYYLNSKNPYLHFNLYLKSTKRPDWTNDYLKGILLNENGRLVINTKNNSSIIGVARPGMWSQDKEFVPISLSEFYKNMIKYDLLSRNKKL